MAKSDVLIAQLQSVLRLLSGRTLGFGSATISWSASATSADQVVTHRMGVVPTHVWVASIGDAPWAIFTTFSYTDTSFTVRGRTVDGTAPTVSRSTFWLAIS